MTKKTSPRGIRKQALRAALERAQAEGKRVLVLVIPQAPEAREDREHALGEFFNHATDRELAPLASVVVTCATADELKAEAEVDVPEAPLLVLLTPGAAGAEAEVLDEPLPFLSLRFGPTEQGSREQEAIVDHRIAQLALLIEQGLGAAPGDVAELARQVREALVQRAPAGARWGRDQGCGVSYEDAPIESEYVRCGMGHVPERSHRFLSFFTADYRAQR